MIWFSILYFFKDSLNALLKTISFRSKNKCADLVYHDFFITLTDVMGKVDRIEFITDGHPDEAKNKILHHIVKIKVTRLEQEITKLLQKPNIGKLNAQELKFELAGALNRTSKESNVTATADFQNWGISEKDIKAVIEGCEEFKELLTEGLGERIESIATNKDYHSNYDKLSAILEVMAISYFMMPRMIKDVFDRMNGRFAKYNKNYDTN